MTPASSFILSVKKKMLSINVDLWKPISNFDIFGAAIQLASEFDRVLLPCLRFIVPI